MSEAPPPLFVLAAPFCGASLLAGRLGRHPQLYAVPELCLFMADTVDELLNIFRLSQGPQADGLLRAIAQLEFGAQQDQEIAAAREWLAQRTQWGTHEVLAELASRVAPRRLVVPDTEGALRPMDLRRIRRHFPQATAIQLYRHPWTQGCLLSAWARERLFMPPDFKDHSYEPPLLDPQIAWLRANATIATAWGTATPLPLRSEDFDEPTAQRLAELCRDLGVRDDQESVSAMQDVDGWVYAGFGPGTAPYGLEADVLEAFADADLQLAMQTSLDAPLPWRPDGASFDAKLVAMARAAGY